MAKGYGSSDQPWHPNFIAYAEEMATHEVYEGMPDTYNDAGLVQWETPSNRKSGKYKDSYQKRLEWWTRKAIDVGIDPESAQWKSKVAKLIHPTMAKPCRQCGTVRDLRYVYPKQTLIDRISKLPYIERTITFDKLEPIYELVSRLHGLYGATFLKDLPRVLSTNQIAAPELGDNLTDWLKWLAGDYIPREPSLLSPGAMSNCPDRFDGFHHLNICCRGTHDPGRSVDNLKSYVTDRRVFEYWTEGDWIAADRLMGRIRSQLGTETCRNGHPGPCTADHIGPLSLGFTHRPEFQLLCHACNSAKNNRMTLSDVNHLRTVELGGAVVTSWHSLHLWNACKNRVRDQETALRLSKLLRDNHHTMMAVLGQIAAERHLTFLTTMLELSRADYSVDFANLRVADHITVYDKLVRTTRTAAHSETQKVRRLRIAFTELGSYLTKPAGNAHIVITPAMETALSSALSALSGASSNVREMNIALHHALLESPQSQIEGQLKELLPSLMRLVSSEEGDPAFAKAWHELTIVVRLLAKELSSRWNHERYVRALRENEE